MAGGASQRGGRMWGISRTISTRSTPNLPSLGPTHDKGTLNIARAVTTGKLSVSFDSNCQQEMFDINLRDGLARKEIGGEQDPTKAKSLRHEEVKEQIDWEYLCDLWSSQTFLDRMLELRSQNFPEDMSDKDILERVLGHHSVRLKGWARSLTTNN
ncbi:hypothetical protein TorRG33x02_065160 [Trema orientale]|uniref:Uncharacterized protein n=1 Tax=Trema orientale TaxID=63057 RepID=A0A2P5FIL0_TREOI|nr:hypothetical protein TorRG33x02_065160 [Trema orientale]